MMMKEKQTEKRLVVELSEREHYEIRKRAAFMNVTIKSWIKLAIMQRIEEETKYE